MYHTAHASTTLKSPKGRTASSGWRNAGNWVRADVYLGWDATDLGTYLATSSHKFYCPVVRLMYTLPRSSGSGTAPYVILTLRTSGYVSGDNSGLNRYIYWEGRDTLGTFYFTGVRPDKSDRGWRTGVEIVGVVLPSSFTGTITIKRNLVGGKLYRYNGPDAYLTYPPGDDSTEFIDILLLDRDPQSGGSGGVVYDLDAPRIGSSEDDFDRVVWRKRVNFRQYAVTNIGLNQVTISNYLSWYTRVSTKKIGLTDQLEISVPGDNQAGYGQTALTWDLR